MKFLQCIKSSAYIRKEPNLDSLVDSECLYGEKLQFIKKKNEWVYCKLIYDKYEGWVESSALITYKKSEHRVINIRSFIHNEPNIKSKIFLSLPIGSNVCVKNEKDDWYQILYLPKKQIYTGYIPKKHVVTINNKVSDWVKVAESFLNVPYKWGGRNSEGIDCSALVQLSLQTAGIFVPRDSCQQIKINFPEIKNINSIKRGTLIFWDGHVGIMINKNILLHANSFKMNVCIEPLNKVIYRIKKNYGKNIIKMLHPT
jgi:cell wall-associated NlpC family hydrolase